MGQISNKPSSPNVLHGFASQLLSEWKLKIISNSFHREKHNQAQNAFFSTEQKAQNWKKLNKKAQKMVKNCVPKM